MSLNVFPSTRSGRFPINSMVLLDWFERVLLVVLSAVLIHRVVQSGGVVLVNVLQVLNEMIVVAAVLFRRSTGAFSNRLGDWVFGAMGTALPLLAAAGGTALVHVGVSAVLMLTGFLWQFGAKIVMWRSFGVVAANRGVKREGPYRFVRHPMYAGYLFMYVGYWLTNPTVRNAAIYLVCVGCMIYRILAEERVLKADPAYVEYAGKTRYRLFPKVW